MPDHPRSCGANAWNRICNGDKCGSSPLVRGQLEQLRNMLSRVRIIPARAGPTSLCVMSQVCYSDHPRSCGANSVSASSLYPCDGSSPLVRGQLCDGLAFTLRIRIIPARAGPTTVDMETLFFLPDHPRSCGANVNFTRNMLYYFGSSPLVRGQLNLPKTCDAWFRIIPARAGPTPCHVETV